MLFFPGCGAGITVAVIKKNKKDTSRGGGTADARDSKSLIH